MRTIVNVICLLGLLGAGAFAHACRNEMEALVVKNVIDGYTILARQYEKVLGATSMVAPAEIELFFDSIPNNSTVLDAGCGPGVESRIGFQKGHQMIGLDITPEMITRYKEEFADAEAFVADMTAIPLGGNGVDAVLSASSLLHLDEARGTQAIREFARVTRKGGWLGLATTIGQGESELHSRAALTNAGVESLYFYHWEKNNLRASLEAAGYEIVTWTEKELVANRPPWVFITAKLSK